MYNYNSCDCVVGVTVCSLYQQCAVFGMNIEQYNSNVHAVLSGSLMYNVW